ncbi:MAG: hypothetical protein ACJAY8_000576 [Sphingobacteriales bacterium]
MFPTTKNLAHFLILGILAFQLPGYGQELSSKIDGRYLIFENHTFRDSIKAHNFLNNELETWFKKGYLEATFELTGKREYLYYTLIKGPEFYYDSIEIKNSKPAPIRKVLARQFSISNNQQFTPKQLISLQKNRIQSQWEVNESGGIQLFILADSLTPSILVNGLFNVTQNQGKAEYEGNFDGEIKDLSRWSEHISVHWNRNSQSQQLAFSMGIKHLFYSPLGIGVQLNNWSDDQIRQFKSEISFRYSHHNGFYFSTHKITDQSSDLIQESSRKIAFLGMGMGIESGPESVISVQVSVDKNANERKEFIFVLRKKQQWKFLFIREHVWVGRKIGDFTKPNFYHMGGYNTLLGVDQGSIHFQKGYFATLTPGIKINKSLHFLGKYQMGEIDKSPFFSYGFGFESIKKQRNLFVVFAFSNLAQEGFDFKQGKLHFGWRIKI